MTAKPTDFGPNRTGIATSPIDSKRLIEGAHDGQSSDGARGVEAMLAERRAYSLDADPFGTLPPPASLKGAAKATLQALKGKNAAVFIDLVAERLAYERTGTRLYEALIAKHDAADPHPGGPTREELVEIRDHELKHFGWLTEALERLGADPTAVTPMADATGVQAEGTVKLLADPRTTLTQGLKAILIIELGDHESWLHLVALAERLGQEEMARVFRTALAEEEMHVAKVRTWLTNMIDGQVGLEPIPPEDIVEGGTSPPGM